MNYDIIKLVHALAAVAATGPLLFAPWLSARLAVSPAENKTVLLNGLAATDRFYNIAGWGLMLSGIALFWLQDWHRAFQLWFVLSVAIFVIDSLAEKRWRDPATTALAQLQPGQEGWAENAARLHKAVIAQMACTALILLVMLLHSQLRINLLTLSLWPWVS
ncbi:hypothetical protein [Serratia odorifera]|uniref:DUF2269 family protein n=2 Tax=Serratia odorifera TaxID=618 RepID=D4E461_SEROD|nr:hypothetical protein [Serratia odorifera]EFE95270.1 hypothetical protein HMPREF0758_2961 [Serratia odorifera DSM 4582]MBJ2064722.1 hypothetical protein [Serratia odorifera]PNK90110.1 hypothetical protein CEQ31_010530 [Serratia odorifera]RII71016.1 hypothetical protein DX901_15785 [Serratia odorifera]VDZ60914.1 Uncharacterised protein [Serratia odorifera]